MTQMEAYAGDRIGRLEDRLRVLSGALRAFAEATTDYQHLLDVVARTVADVVKDGCVVRLLSEGWLTPVAFHLPLETYVRDATAAARVRAFLAAPQRVADYAWGERLIETGEAFLAPHIDRTLLTAEVAEVYETIGVQSLLVTTLRVRGETIGTLSLFRIDPAASPFDEHDRDLAQALADHAALAMTNARLLQSARHELAERERADAGRREAERALQSSETSLRRLAEANIVGLIVSRDHGPIVEANDAFLGMLGYSRDDLDAGRLDWSKLTAPEWRGSRDVIAAQLASHGFSKPLEKEYVHKDGRRIPAIVCVARVGGSRTISITLDLTDRRRLEQQFRQAQKMEAVGRLAGGVAHDFNNVLSVILSYSELILDDLKPEEPLRADIEEIKKAAWRATDLTRQLLAFSRQQVLETRVLNLNERIDDIQKMLDRLLGADIKLTLLPAKGLQNIEADPGQIDQILMNLAVNARDAMPQGGTLTIETANVELDDEYALAHHEVRAGSYVMLAVSDNGIGMDKETQARIFEPFFTTKEKGKGTGLGLATVFGIVKQSGGHIWLYSESGAGATFKVYFPIVSGPAAKVLASEEREGASLRGSETILLVEDDAQLLALARGILRRHGYVVVEAANGGEALLVCEQHEARIDLLLTDVVLPRMSGRQLAERLATMRPKMKVLFMSGYTDDAILQHGILDSGVAFLQKPLTPTSLTRKVRAVLDDRGSPRMIGRDTK